MKRAFLLIAVPTLLVALGFAQTPAASSNTDQTTVEATWVAPMVITQWWKTTPATFSRSRPAVLTLSHI